MFTCFLLYLSFQRIRKRKFSKIHSQDDFLQDGDANFVIAPSATKREKCIQEAFGHTGTGISEDGSFVGVTRGTFSKLRLEW
jgi:hypothetical protein